MHLSFFYEAMLNLKETFKSMNIMKNNIVEKETLIFSELLVKNCQKYNNEELYKGR